MDRQLLDIKISNIPTASRARTRAMKPNHLPVISRFFQAGILKREQQFLRGEWARAFG